MLKNTSIGAIALIAVFALYGCEFKSQTQVLASALALNDAGTHISSVDNSSIEQAFQYKKSDVQVSGGGVVIKLLADDTKGVQHQKFLVKINPQQTLLFAHNIDLAPRIPLQINDTITFSGEYVYNPKGGIVHWTHLDPSGTHAAGWVNLHGKTYQ
ncbi:MAG: DUF3465 domain-containing protein [Methylophilaceae bacterium]